MDLADKITIKCSPDRVYETLTFFFHSSENYKLWHSDHISCYWKKGKDFSKNSILVAEEYIHNVNHRLNFMIMDCIVNSSIEYKMTFPFSLICSGGSFRMVKHDNNNTELLATLSFRFGKVLRLLFSKKIDALRKHMYEEGQNIKNIIENNKLK